MRQPGRDMELERVEPGTRGQPGRDMEVERVEMIQGLFGSKGGREVQLEQCYSGKKGDRVRNRRGTGGR